MIEKTRLHVGHLLDQRQYRLLSDPATGGQSWPRGDRASRRRSIFVIGRKLILQHREVHPKLKPADLDRAAVVDLLPCAGMTIDRHPAATDQIDNPQSARSQHEARVN